MGLLANILSRTLFRSTNQEIDRMLEDARAGKPIATVIPDPKSGVLRLDGEMLEYDSPDYGRWKTQFSDIVAFGEYTTDNGPFIDDWFMVFVSKDLEWVEASNFCAGRDEVRSRLAELWGQDGLHEKLWGSTDFASRVIWPAALAEQPLFVWTPRPQSLWEKIKSCGIVLLDKDLTPCVRHYLLKT